MPICPSRFSPCGSSRLPTRGSEMLASAAASLVWDTAGSPARRRAGSRKTKSGTAQARPRPALGSPPRCAAASRRLLGPATPNQLRLPRPSAPFRPRAPASWPRAKQRRGAVMETARFIRLGVFSPDSGTYSSAWVSWLPARTECPCTERCIRGLPRNCPCFTTRRRRLAASHLEPAFACFAPCALHPVLSMPRQQAPSVSRLLNRRSVLVEAMRRCASHAAARRGPTQAVMALTDPSQY